MRVVTAVAVLSLCALWGAPARGSADDIVVTGLDLVSSQRVSRTVYEYQFRINLNNPEASLTNVVGTASSNAGATTIIEGQLSVGDFPSGALTPADTITIQHNRRYRFRPSNLSFAFSGDEVVQNQAPVADTGVDQAVEVGVLVTLSGASSFDPEGAGLSFAWQLSVPPGSTSTLDDPTSTTPTFTPDVAGVYSATLTVNDGQLDSAPDTAQVDVTAPVQNPPVITTQPMSSSFWISSRWANVSVRTCSLSALSLSGRLTVRMATRPSRSNRTAGSMLEFS